MKFTGKVTPRSHELGARSSLRHFLAISGRSSGAALIPYCERYVLIEAGRDGCPQPSEMLAWPADA